MKTLLRSLLSALALSGALAAPALAQNVNVQTGATYTFLNTDCDPSGHRLVNFNSSVSVAVTLPAAGVNGQFTNGCIINAKNIGSGLVTITPTTSTIDGTTSYALNAGGSVTILNDATGATLTNGNYWTLPGQSYSSALPITNFRNVLLDTDFGINAYSTGISNTNSGASPPTATYVGAPDTWFSTAVSASANLSVVRVSGPASSGISNFEKIQRVATSTSALGFYGIGQEIDSGTVIPLQGQQMVGSFNALADTLFSANLSAMNVYVLTGTSINEGTSTGLSNPVGNLGTSFPWTGFTGGAVTYTQTIPLTASNARYTFGPFTMPATAKEAIVLLGYVPAAGSTAGATDDMQIGNIQLEAGRYPSAFEHLPLATVTGIARQFVQCPLQENTSAVNIAQASGQGTSTTTGNLVIPLVPPMRATPSTMLSLLGSIEIMNGSAALSPTSIGVAALFTPNSAQLPIVVSGTLSPGGMILGAADKVVGTGFYCIGANF